MNITLEDSFVESQAALAPAEGKRVTLFLDKLLHSPDSGSLHPEIVHDAQSRQVRSLKVTHDLRAIAYVAGEDVRLLYVDQHDDAYRWARDHCIECHPVTGQLTITLAG